MKNLRFKIILAALSFFVFFFISIFLYPHFLMISHYQLDLEKINIVTTFSTLTDSFGQRDQFSFAIAILPILFYTCFLIVRPCNLKQRVWIVSTTLFSGVIFWQLKVLWAYLLIRKIDYSYRSSEVKPEISLDQFQFSLFLLIGLFTGAIINTVVFRLKNFKTAKKRVDIDDVIDSELR
ncbi:MAG: hypothetical protein AAFX87_27495 [Bacteroidota bacterium]